MALIARTALAQESEAPSTPLRDPYKDRYAEYTPDFVAHIAGGSGYGRPFRGWQRDEETMKLSSETAYFTLNLIDEDARANALIEAGLAKETQGQHREALKIYQQVIDKYPRSLYRVSEFGIFVPVSQYCQRRILQFPPEDLRFYRTLYDAQAREAFEQAQRQYSLAGLSDIVERSLATSYGGRAMLALGDAALDAGHYLAALERYTTVRDFFPDRDLQTPELALKIAYCEKLLGGNASQTGNATSPGNSALSPEQLDQLDRAVSTARRNDPPFHKQLTSGPHIAADDYTLMPPTSDPLGIAEPVWKFTLPGTRDDFFVYTQPVVTDSSVIYRQQNLVYCRSILNGELRWTYRDCGRARWQNWYERQYPQEDLLVQDGLVFTVVNKTGPSLVALDEVTGQLRWAYGPMVAADEEQARMRFEAAPAGGAQTVYAGYVLDNIEGETHTDTEYGLIAFESTTGRLRWRVPLCRLAPGKFSGGFAETRRNRVRSFTSPPLVSEGTVYYNTCAGAVAAVDTLSGRVKWLMRYPYYPGVHDATRQFGRGGEIVQHSRVYFRPHSPMFWYNQRPLLVGERLFVAPVDTNLLICLDRGTGKVRWSRPKTGSASAYLLGMTRDDQLAVAYTGRAKKIGATDTTGPIHLLDPDSGETLWQSPDLVRHEEQPVMKHYVFGSVPLNFRANESWFETSARPTMTAAGRVYVPSHRYLGYPIFGYVSNLGVLDLNERKVLDHRRFFSGEVLARADSNIGVTGPEELKAFLDKPQKSDEDKARIQMLQDVVADTVPENEHAPFLPFERITCARYGVPFELRVDARSIAMVYDRGAVAEVFAGRDDPPAIFARAELAVANSNLDEAASLLETCLARISSEDLDFRTAINQQLYRVHLRLARRAVRAGRRDEELAACLGMSRTAGTLAEEIETLFAVADAYRRQEDFAASARALQTIVSTYGHHEVPLAPIAVADHERLLTAARDVIARYRDFVGESFFSRELTRSLELTERGLPLYLSTVSPLPKTLSVRAGELAARRLIELEGLSSDFAAEFQRQATATLADKPLDERFNLLSQFPATAAAQKTLEGLLGESRQLPQPHARRALWALADAARVSGLSLPAESRLQLDPAADEQPADSPSGRAPLTLPLDPQEHDFADEDGAARLVLERRGNRETQPQLLFVGSRIRRRLDNKFVLTAMDLATGKVAWETGELRLKGKGQEPGFFEAFVLGELVVVHGLYDVLAFGTADGSLRWRYRVPFDFEIRSAVLSGDLLVLSGATETLCLYVPTESETGELVWQESELGDPYLDTYVEGDRVVSVRKLPFNLTVRYRHTGRLIGRLDLPDLSLQATHPLLENGPETLPAARSGKLLVLTDSWYYILLDTDQLAVVWKRLIDNNDVTREPPLRLALSPEYLAVLKEDYDQKALYLISVETGDVLWRTDPRDTNTPQPMHAMFLAGDTLFGIEPHAGQGYYVVARDCTTGQRRFRQEVTGYQAKPQVTLLPHDFGGHLVVRIADRQTFELRAFSATTGEPAGEMSTKGVGPYGIHGRMSATVQHGQMVLMSKEKLQRSSQ